MYVLTIKGVGVEQLGVGLNRLLRLGDNISTAWPEVVRELRQVMARQFTSQGGSGQSGRWASLSERYQASKARTHPGRTILERTGALRASLQVQTSQSVIEEKPRSLFFGSSVPYGIYHQTGTGRLPRRAIFSLTNQQAAGIGSVLHKWLGREVSKALAGARAA